MEEEILNGTKKKNTVAVSWDTICVNVPN